jgi:hypothetical protein
MVQKIGFSGTRKGMTVVQKMQFLETVWYQVADNRTIPRRALPFEFHHGNCIGADFEAHLVIKSFFSSVTAHIWPSDNLKTQVPHGQYGALLNNCIIHTPGPPLMRDQWIVEATHYLIATPHGPEQTRSGTWTTIRYARKLKRQIHIIMPDGEEIFEPAG